MLKTFFFFLAAQCGIQDLSSLTRDQTCTSAVEAQSPNHWTIRKFLPAHNFLIDSLHYFSTINSPK